MGIETQSHQDRGRDLGRVDSIGKYHLLELGITDEAGNLAIIITKSAMFGNFGLGGSIAGTQTRSDDNVGDTRRLGRIAKSLCGEVGAVDQRLGLHFGSVLLEVGGRRGNVGSVVKPQQPNIIGLHHVSSICGVGGDN